MYVPPIMSVRKQREDFDVAVRAVLARRGGGIALHEGHALTDADNCGDALNVALFQGAAWGIPMIYAFQEPVRLWRPFLTQANVVIVTYLGQAHLDLLARELSAPELAEPRPADFSFIVWERVPGGMPRLIRCPPLALAA